MNEEKNKEFFKSIRANKFKDYIDKIIVGRSVSYPDGWIYKADVKRLIENIKWNEY